MRATTSTFVSTATIEQKILALRITLALTVISFITFLITLTSSQWVAITYPPDFYVARQKMFVLESTYGIIRECSLGRATQNSTLGKYRLGLN
jgi:hypothetical protein